MDLRPGPRRWREWQRKAVGVPAAHRIDRGPCARARRTAAIHFLVPWAGRRRGWAVLWLWWRRLGGAVRSVHGGVHKAGPSIGARLEVAGRNDPGAAWRPTPHGGRAGQVGPQ